MKHICVLQTMAGKVCTRCVLTAARSYESCTGPVRCVAAAARAGLAAPVQTTPRLPSPRLPSTPRATAPLNVNLLAASDDAALHLHLALLAKLHAFRRHEADEGLAVHPSTRAALAVSRAGSLAMLNLVRGHRYLACHLEPQCL